MYSKFLIAVVAVCAVAQGVAACPEAKSCKAPKAPKAPLAATKKPRATDDAERTRMAGVYARESELLARQLREAIAKLKPEEIRALIVILSDGKLLESIAERVSEAMRTSGRVQIVVTPSTPSSAREGAVYYYYPSEKGAPKPAEEKNVNQLQETIRQFITP
jgi:vacuolar-type H+-ATPase subunit F/Vma7